MTEVELPAWVALLTAMFLIVGASLTVIGSFGLLRLGSFYQRLHAPTLGSTLGMGSILLASMVYFSAIETRPVLHEILIAVFVTVTTPVTFILLVRATRHRGSDDLSSSVPNPHDMRRHADRRG